MPTIENARNRLIEYPQNADSSSMAELRQIGYSPSSVDFETLSSWLLNPYHFELPSRKDLNKVYRSGVKEIKKFYESGTISDEQFKSLVDFLTQYYFEAAVNVMVKDYILRFLRKSS